MLIKEVLPEEKIKNPINNQDDGYLNSMDDVEILGITADSRKVSNGFVFAALPGVKVDGINFVPQAIENGASAILLHDKASITDEIKTKASNSNVLLLGFSNPRKAFSQMVANFYGKQPKSIVAVTGTNGKTSTCSFVRQIWGQLGEKSASIGTLGIVAPGFPKTGTLTTPDSATLHQHLHDMAEAGVTRLAMEASSHGLHQYRVTGVKVKAGAFTNLTRDHMDYHQTMESYLDAKMMLFEEEMQKGGTAVINADIPEYAEIVKRCRAKELNVISYGENKGADISLKYQTLHSYGQDITLKVFDNEYSFTLPLIGTFQAMNAMCALGLIIAEGADVAETVATLSRLQVVPGRLEHVGTLQNGGTVLVDYAHTPDALETVLKAIRPHTEGKLHVLFGCGGDRDKGKRPQMGAIAQELADVAIVSDDNPRSEDPDIIRSEIMPACPDALEIGDRGKAVFEAIKGLESDDVLVIAGKGHESGQTVNGVVHPFDDRDVARDAIHEIHKELLDLKPLWTIDEISNVLHRECSGKWAASGISIDTRTVKHGDLFVALSGDNFDGSDYIYDALRKGAVGVITNKMPEDFPENRVFLYSDTLQALELLAEFARKRSKAKRIAVTGSVGKTSTKEMLLHALSEQGKTHATIGNLNNHIGMPLTLSRLPADADYCILEMGMNHLGEITPLSKLGQPEIALITSVAEVHMEFFKSIEEIADAKAEIFDGLIAGGTAILHADNPCYDRLCASANKKGVENIVSFGESENADIRLKSYSVSADGISVEADVCGEVVSYSIGTIGKHWAINSLAVLALVKAIGADVKKAAASLSAITPPRGRGKRTKVQVNGGTAIIIDDSYNASPMSMKAGLEVLAQIEPENKGRRIAVMGDMLELGEKSVEMHVELKDKIAECGVDKVYTAGSNMKELFNALPSDIQGACADNSTELKHTVIEGLRAGDVVLIKGSSGSKMGLIVDALVG
ncbi:MAG: UDP-N-acetylmuramoyl-L-alanyl-D-glutamate--2,6-diaminopimelate ligase [Alphaproteobacteria bacterium]|nr:UDP-N-acetylmuramoyl-L-alanyl-D-glutamate--2,6-diaminopimelate ligase [Alphaproteobacteria bacterium]